QDLFGVRIVQRRGCGHEAFDVRNIARQPGNELSAEGVGGENGVAGAHHSVRATQFHAVWRILDGEDTRLLENLRARAFGGGGEPARENKRMQMAAAEVEPRAAIDLRTNPLSGFLRTQ